MVLPENNGYNNHLELFSKLFSLRKFDNILEYGTGDSSEFLAANTKKLISLEMQDKAWGEKIKAKNTKNHLVAICIGPGGHDFVKEYAKGEFDLVFVDGHGDTRPECINAAFDMGVKYVVTHDTEEPGYGWDRVNVPEGFASYTFKKHKEWSTIYTDDKELLSELEKWASEGYPEAEVKAEPKEVKATAKPKTIAPKKAAVKKAAVKKEAKVTVKKSVPVKDSVAKPSDTKPKKSTVKKTDKSYK